MKVSVAISNRHVHLTKDVYNKLFDEPISVRNYLNQKGEFASNSTVNIKCGDKIIEHVRVVGPFRKYSQVELSKDDADYLEINPPIRTSGDLNNSETVFVSTDKTSIKLVDSTIIANVHIHMNEEYAKENNFYNKETVKVKYLENVFEANIKVSENGYFEMHVDKYIANKYDLTNGCEVEILG